LHRAGLAAGLDAVAIEQEAAAFVAAIIAPAPDAAQRWAAAFSRPVAAFAAAARQGRSWRDHPTPLLSRIVEVAPAEARSYADALADLNKAIELSPRSVRAHFLRGQVAAERELQNPPPRLQPLQAGFINLPQQTLDSFLLRFISSVTLTDHIQSRPFL
jgi:hypothetical protein